MHLFNRDEPRALDRVRGSTPKQTGPVGPVFQLRTTGDQNKLAPPQLVLPPAIFHVAGGPAVTQSEAVSAVPPLGT